MAIKTPGSVLNGLLKKYDMNCNRLAKAINMSNAMVRLLVLDKSPISLSAAFRLAKFFKTKPEYWLDLQLKYDLSRAAKDKKLTRDLNNITDVTKYSFVRKPHASTGRKKTAKKTTGRKPAGRKPAAKKTAGKRKTTRKVTARRPRTTRTRRVTRRK